MQQIRYAMHKRREREHARKRHVIIAKACKGEKEKREGIA